MKKDFYSGGGEENGEGKGVKNACSTFKMYYVLVLKLAPLSGLDANKQQSKQKKNPVQSNFEH